MVASPFRIIPLKEYLLKKYPDVVKYILGYLWTEDEENVILFRYGDCV